MWYAEKQIDTWPTCTQASAEESTFALMWAKMNRCSYIYDIRNFQKLNQIEKQMLSWLEKEVWPKLHRKAQFHGKVDIPRVLPQKIRKRELFVERICFGKEGQHTSYSSKYVCYRHICLKN